MKKLKRSEMTKTQLTNYFLANSSLFADWNGERLYLELRGELASVPNMKRGRIALKNGSNIMNPSAYCKIKAMEILYNDYFMDDSRPFFEASQFPLIMFVELPGKKKFDAIGAAETLADFFEPANKPVGRKQAQRGWGVGLYIDDTDLIVVPMKSSHTGNEGSDFARVAVTPFVRVQSFILEGFARAHL